MGDRFASPSAITPDTVEHLAQAWIYRTGDAARDGDRFRSRFNATPILAGGKLFFSTGFKPRARLGPRHRHGTLELRPGSGGPMVTEGGVVFHATTSDHRFRAYDGADGSELWSVVLPAGAHSTPMGYRHDGMDYVVITAGEGLTQGRGRGDFVVACSG